MIFSHTPTLVTEERCNKPVFFFFCDQVLLIRRVLCEHLNPTERSQLRKSQSPKFKSLNEITTEGLHTHSATGRNALIIPKRRRFSTVMRPR